MKKSFAKVFSILSIIVVITAITTVVVSASSYYYSFNIGNGGDYSTPVNSYDAGPSLVQFKVNSWTNYNNLGYTRLQDTLIRDTGLSSQTVGVRTFRITSNSNYAESFGQQSAGNYYHHFSTYVNGTTYGGVQSNSVHCYTT